MNLYWTDCSALQMELFKVLRALIEENSLFLNISITAKMKMTTLESLESYKFRILFSFNEEKPLAAPPPPPPISFSFILELTCSFSTFKRGIFDHAIVINNICPHKVGFVSKYSCVVHGHGPD